MRSKRENTVYLKHIVDAIEKINEYLANHSFEDFSKKEWDQDATVRNLEIIGEAGNNLDIEFRNQRNHIPWRAIIDFRNFAIHDYADIDLDIVWSIITVNLPELLQQVKTLLTEFES